MALWRFLVLGVSAPVISLALPRSGHSGGNFLPWGSHNVAYAVNHGTSTPIPAPAPATSDTAAAPSPVADDSDDTSSAAKSGSAKAATTLKSSSSDSKSTSNKGSTSGGGGGAIGLAVNNPMNFQPFTSAAGSLWYYNWDFTASAGGDGLEFVPMVWGSDKAKAVAGVAAGWPSGTSKVMSFNERESCLLQSP